MTIEKNKSLKEYTTFKIGGPAEYFADVKTAQEVQDVLQWAKDNNQPVKILGGGSNMLIADAGLKGLVVKLSLDKLEFDDLKVTVGPGVRLAYLLNKALEQDLTGLEFAAGIPGTVGGAIRGNAGTYGLAMDSVVKKIKYADENGQLKEITATEAKFAYRHSIFKDVDNKDIILSVVFELQSGDRAKIKQKMKEIIMERNKKFNNYSCAGCVFKNIEISENEWSEIKKKWPNLPDEFLRFRKIPAGWLIEECDLKGKKIGGAQVSDQHANVIINAGQATAEDVIILTSIIKQKVRSKFNLQLMEEIEYLGFK